MHIGRVVIAVLLVAIEGSTAGAATGIKLREQAATSGSVVRLGDVADVVNADRREARRLASLPLFPAPAPGTQRFLRKREIEDLLAAYGVDLNELQFYGAAQVTIGAANAADANARQTAPEPRPFNRHAAILAGVDNPPPPSSIDPQRAERLQRRLHSVVSDYVKSQTGDVSLSMTCQAVDRHLALLDSATSNVTCDGGSPPWTGRQRLVVSFTTARGKMEIPVYAQIAAPSLPVAVASKPIARGEQITAAHVELRTMESAASAIGRRSTFDSIDALIGMQARQAIQAGDIVFADHVQAPLLIKRGELVTVSSQGNGIRVRTTARAWKDGAHGDVVQVESLNTRERFDVQVVGPREAVVVAISNAARPAAPSRVDTARRSP
jgi:flagella basal body P-ring formation protein FlgA